MRFRLNPEGNSTKLTMDLYVHGDVETQAKSIKELPTMSEQLFAVVA